MTVYSKDTLKLNIKDKDKQNIKDVATRLVEQLENQKCKFTIDVAGLLNAFASECGVDFDKIEKEKDSLPTFIMMIGIPGSGKSTIVNDLAKEYNASVVCPDQIRKNLTGDISDQSRNNEVWSIAKQFINDALDGNINVILDATNTVSKYRKKFIEDLKPCIKKAKIIECDVKTAFRRITIDIQHGVDRSNVPLDVIQRMYKQLNNGRANITQDFQLI
jgi:predicted kinase